MYLIYSQTPESPEVRAFAATHAPPPWSGKIWHGTAREALQLRRAIHRQVCELNLHCTEFQGVCRPNSTPLFSQRELDGLVFARRTAQRYVAEEFRGSPADWPCSESSLCRPRQPARLKQQQPAQA